MAVKGLREEAGGTRSPSSRRLPARSGNQGPVIKTNEHTNTTTQYNTTQDALSAAGIQPSERAAYSGPALSAALQRGLGVGGHHVFCDANGDLAEIWTCVGLDLRPFD